MMLSPLAQAQKVCQTDATKIKEKCDKALKAADDVILKQGTLINITSQQNNELRDENQKLSDALVELNQQSKDQARNLLLTAGGGLLLGILAGFLVSK